jgi:uncharacterized membrane protein YdcZ (DUF606 family)
MSAPELQSRWKTRAWAWRVAMVAFVVLPVPLLSWCVNRNVVSVFGACAAFSGFLAMAVGASVCAEKAEDRATLPESDRLILGRFRHSSLRLLAVIIALSCVIPFCMDFLEAHLHFSAAEAFVAISVPYWLVSGKLRKLFGVAGGGDAETMRAHALLIDRDRRQFVWGYTVFALMWLLETGTWLPQMQRALNGQKVNLGQLHVFGIFAVSSLFMLYGPRRIFDTKILGAMAEDESLTAYRDQAFRYGFFTLALGMIVIFDVAVRNPRLGLVMLPVLFAASQIIGFLTLAIQEFRAGRLGDAEGEDGAPGRADFRGSAALHGG